MNLSNELVEDGMQHGITPTTHASKINKLLQHFWYYNTM